MYQSYAIDLYFMYMCEWFGLYSIYISNTTALDSLFLLVFVENVIREVFHGCGCACLVPQFPRQLQWILDTSTLFIQIKELHHLIHRHRFLWPFHHFPLLVCNVNCLRNNQKQSFSQTMIKTFILHYLSSFQDYDRNIIIAPCIILRIRNYK